MNDKEFIAVFHYDNGGTNRCGAEPYRYAEEIVRCKECKYREKYPCDEIEFYECGHLRFHGTKVGVKDDWFCADGERREPWKGADDDSDNI